MQVVSLICNEAGADEQGRLDIHGVFQALFAPDFPARQKHLVFVGLLQWDAGETGRLPFHIELQGEDGISVFTIEGHTDVRAPEPGEPPPMTQLVLPMDDIVFPAPGRYRFMLQVDGMQHEGASLFLCRNATEPPPHL